MTFTRSAPALLALAGLALAAPALAQNAQPNNSPSKAAPASQPASPAAADPAQAAALLQRASAALNHLSSFAYTARTSGTPQPGSATVLLKKADAGGWKLMTRSDAPGSDLRAAYDGLSARVIDEPSKTIWNHNTEDLAAVRAVFARRNADAPILWELLAPPSPENSPSNAALGQPAPGNGGPCHAVTLTLAPATGDNANAARTTLYIADTDHLPRRIVRAAADGPALTIDLTDLEVDKSIPDAVFTIDTPAQFVVKSAAPGSPAAPPSAATPAAARPKPAPAPQASFGLALGDAAPEWTLKDPAGQEHKLSDYKGKVVLMDFWGTWCPPCRAAMPGIQRLHEQYKDKPVAVLGMNYERRASDDPVKFMKDKGFTYGLLLKADTIAPTYKIQGWPTFYILDKEGKIAWSALGHDPDHEAQMTKVIDELLAK